MKRTVLAVLAVFSLTACSPLRASSVHPDRYVYCNVHASTFCFGIAAGDTLNMTIPVDFVIYEVTTLKGVSGTIYVGRQPEETPEELIVNRRSYNESGFDYEYRKLKSGEFEILYRTPEQSSVIAHIRLKTADGGASKTLVDFLENFRPCVAASATSNCTDSSIFAQLLRDGL